MEQLKSEKKEVLRKASQKYKTFISSESLIKLLVKYGKGRRSVERQGSESPHFSKFVSAYKIKYPVSLKLK